MTLTWWYLIPLAFAMAGACCMGLAIGYPVGRREVKWILIALGLFGMAFLLVFLGVR